MSGEVEIGGSWYEQTIARVPSSQNLRLYARDITEHKRVDQIKDEFISMVSHELRTPLTVIMGVLGVLSHGGLSDGNVSLLLKDATLSVREMNDIVANLLELSRSQAGRLVIQPEAVDVVSVARDVVEELERASTAHRLTVSSPAEPPIALADAHAVERILYNLIENAIKYSPGGGDITVTAHQRNSRVVVAVRDQGIGISQEDQSRIFQSFERIDAYTTDSVAGVGLGLMVCRVLVEALGGSIWVESVPGSGAAFSFSLPASEGQTAG